MWLTKLYESKTTHAAKLVGGILYHYCVEQRAILALPDLERLTGWTHNTVRKGIRELEASGLIKREFKRLPGNSYHSSIYHFN